MNTRTGQVYELPPAPQTPEEMTELTRELDRLYEEELRAAAAAGVDPGQVVPVSDDVAETVRVGQAERKRRGT